MIHIPQWTVFETTLKSARHYDDPFWELMVEVHLTAPSGREQIVDAFWDGADIWRVRFSPDELGEWRWSSHCSNPADAGLHARQGRFRSVPYTGDNPLYQNGPLRRSEDRRHFVHTDGKPFFWLGDTAWNGVLRSREKDWQRYLQTRRQQGFTAIQFVSTQWRGCSRDPIGEAAFAGSDRIRLSPQFFQRLDPKVAAINDHGLVAAPVLLWALQKDDPGQALSERAAIRLVRYLVARWEAYSVVWILGGDGDYRGTHAQRWKHIGNAVWGQRHDRLVTMHPCGQQWVGDEFRAEPWFDFIGYQSGHGDASAHLLWLIKGPPATEWDKEPILPVVNLEPNYELHPAYHSQKPFTDREVRRAAYWSLIIAPTAGVTFGHNAIWVWAEQPEVPEGHAAIGTVPPWDAGLDTPGVRSMALLRRFFDALPWWELRPAPELLAEQPGLRDPRRFVAAAMTQDKKLAVVYLPQGHSIELRAALLGRPTVARWFNPRAGAWTDAGQVNGATQSFATPDKNDWILYIGASSVD
jgi:hypothetical protein